MYEVQWKNQKGVFETILMTQMFELTFYLPRFRHDRRDLSKYGICFAELSLEV